MEKHLFSELGKDKSNINLNVNSWYVQKPLSECKSKHAKKANSGDFVVHFFECFCGEKYVCINQSDKFLKHKCEKCSSEKYTFLAYADRSTAYVSLERTYDFTKTDDYYMMTCHLKRPKQINLDTKTLIYENKVAYELRFDNNCVFSSRTSYRITNTTKALVMEELLDYIWKEIQKKIKNFDILRYEEREYEAKESIVSFFITHSNFVEAEFYFVEDSYRQIISKKESYTIQNMLDDLLPQDSKKALKRSFYKNYQLSMEKRHFHVVSKMVFFDIFEDQNFLIPLLEQDISFYTYIEDKIEDKVSLFKSLLIFLKRFYTEKELFKLCLQAKEHAEHWKDTVSMYKYSRHQIENDFERVATHIVYIHNAFASLIHHDNENITYRYAKEQKLCMGTHKDLRYIFPHDSKTLFIWGGVLKNCLGTYKEQVNKKLSVIIGIHKGNELKYAMEIESKSNQIVQMYGFANSKIPGEQATLIHSWYRNIWLKNVKLSTKI